MWIATVGSSFCNWFILSCSNPFPFLLWIATLIRCIETIFQAYVVTLFHFYCGLRRELSELGKFKFERSNPFPFLLWIATVAYIVVGFFYFFVVTLFHFYCGLRPPAPTFPLDNMQLCSNPFPFLLWIATCGKVLNIFKNLV